jgi:hypothetical protein
LAQQKEIGYLSAIFRPEIPDVNQKLELVRQSFSQNR